MESQTTCAISDVKTQLFQKTPKAVSIEITTKCPLQCTYCIHERGKGEDLSYEDFLKLKDALDDIPGLNRVVFCGIGESLMHKDFYRMIHDLRKYRVSIVTSGTLLINYEELSRFDNADILILSIDATCETLIKTICGEKYNYSNLMDNIANFKKYKKGIRSAKKLVLNCTINENNIDEIPKLMDFAGENGFDNVNYSITWGSYELVEANLDRITENVKSALDKAKNYKISVLDPMEISCCFDLSGILPFISLKGENYPCGYAITQHFSVGNLLETDFSDMMGNPKYMDFLNFSLCNKCSVANMYNFIRERVSKNAG